MKPWVKAGLFWALWMFVIMTFVVPYIFVWTDPEDEEMPNFKISRIAISAVVFAVTGLLVGYLNRNNKKIKKQIDS